MKNKHFFTRLLTGFKKGLFTPTLPENVRTFQSYPLIRILRVLGGLSLLFILSKTYSNFPIYYLYIAINFVFLFTIYHFVISYYRVKHIIKLLKSDDLEVRNSPLDRIATFGARIVLCLKGSCEAAQPLGVALGLALGADEIFKSAGREPVFVPIFGGVLNAILPDNTDKAIASEINKHLKQIEENNQEMKAFKSIIDQVNQGNKSGSFTRQEAADFITGINEHINTINENTGDLKSKILAEIGKNNKK